MISIYVSQIDALTSAKYSKLSIVVKVKHPTSRRKEDSRDT